MGTRTTRIAALLAAWSVLTVAEASGQSNTYRRYFAEGATGAFFDTSIALANPGDAAATVTLRFLKTDGQTATTTVALPAKSRRTVRVGAVSGMEKVEFSTVIESDQPIVADRTMTWDASGYGSHAETSIAAPATTWYLAEGATHSGFNLFYLVQNPSSTRADVQVKYLLPAPAPAMTKTYSVAPNSRFTIWVNQENAALASTDVSGVVTATNGVPVIVERAMYLDAQGQTFGAGHASAGVTAASTEWFLAEGATGNYFDLFVLVANPSTQVAQIEATYLLPTGGTLVKRYTVGAESRYTIWVDQEDAQLANTAVSTTIRSTNGVSVIVERSMWWPGPTAGTWREAHNSAGSTTKGIRWALAEGEVGGTAGTQTYILIANASTTAGSVNVTLLYEDGETAVKTFTLNASSRFSLDVAAEFSAAANRRFGAIVESTGPSPVQIVVERAMYSNSGGVAWAAGTNALATPLITALALPQLTVFGNRTDPGLLSIKTTAGNTFYFFGEKDAAGLTTLVTGIHAVLQDGTALTILTDAAGNPIQIQTTNGVTLYLKWLSASELIVDATDSQNTVQGVRVTLPDAVSPQIHTFSGRTAAATQAHINALEGEVRVSVRKCGSPVNNASVIVTAGADELSFPFWASPDGSRTGTYVARIPVLDPDAGLRETEKCLAAAWDIVQFAVDLPEKLEQIAPIVVGALTRIPVGVILALKIETFMRVALSPLVAELTLATVTAAGICPIAGAAIDRFVNTATVVLTPNVTVGSQLITGASITASALGNFPPIQVDIPGVCPGARYSGSFEATGGFSWVQHFESRNVSCSSTEVWKHQLTLSVISETSGTISMVGQTSISGNCINGTAGSGTNIPVTIIPTLGGPSDFSGQVTAHNLFVNTVWKVVGNLGATASGTFSADRLNTLSSSGMSGAVTGSFTANCTTPALCPLPK